MSLEIERKFLVKNLGFIEESYDHKQIIQGYICRQKENTVRVRMNGEKAFLTIKGKSSEDGLVRVEWEKEISEEEAKELVVLCGNTFIEKTRYLVNRGKHIFEIDVFIGENRGLILAEIELNYKDEDFEKPQWLGEEVTGKLEYYNTNLCINPYSKWDKAK